MMVRRTNDDEDDDLACMGGVCHDCAAPFPFFPSPFIVSLYLLHPLHPLRFLHGLSNEY